MLENESMTLRLIKKLQLELNCYFLNNNGLVIFIPVIY